MLAPCTFRTFEHKREKLFLQINQSIYHLRPVPAVRTQSSSTTIARFKPIELYLDAKPEMNPDSYAGTRELICVASERTFSKDHLVFRPGVENIFSIESLKLADGTMEIYHWDKYGFGDADDYFARISAYLEMRGFFYEIQYPPLDFIQVLS
jgi:hypothetical protein